MKQEYPVPPPAVACADCGGPIGEDKGPPDGWQLEDSRTVCHACCVLDFRSIVDAVLSGSKGGDFDG
jgi:hypothetical protein